VSRCSPAFHRASAAARRVSGGVSAPWRSTTAASSAASGRHGSG
jgi:hypothetical protein